MESKNSISVDDRFKIMFMLYRGLKIIAPTVAYYTENERTIIIDADGKELLNKPSSEVIVTGSFSVTATEDGSDTVITNYINFKRKVLPKYFNEFNLYLEVAKSIGDKFLALSLTAKDYRKINDRQNKISSWINDSGVSIFNMELEEVARLYNVRGIKIPEDNSEINPRFYYKMMHFDPNSTYGWHCGIVNNQSGKVVVLDSFELDIDNYSLIGTSWCDDGISINTLTLDHIKYRLGYYGKAISNEYQDITKPYELKGTNFHYTYELDKKTNKRLKGIINDKGVELVKPEFSSIKYIGKNNFILDFSDYSEIYSSESQSIIVEPLPKGSIRVHETLPITLITKSKTEYECLDCFGRRFELKDISKYFNCSYCNSNPDIIKFIMPDGQTRKYITNHLVPVTNVHLIAQLDAESFTRM
jgi:hypothetical protein